MCEPSISCTVFQSTPPRREVTIRTTLRESPALISIHTSPKGGDATRHQPDSTPHISIHTSPKGGDACMLLQVRRACYFNPHLPEGR